MNVSGIRLKSLYNCIMHNDERLVGPAFQPEWGITQLSLTGRGFGIRSI